MNELMRLGAVSNRAALRIETGDVVVSGSFAPTVGNPGKQRLTLEQAFNSSEPSDVGVQFKEAALSPLIPTPVLFLPSPTSHAHQKPFFFCGRSEIVPTSEPPFSFCR